MHRFFVFLLLVRDYRAWRRGLKTGLYYLRTRAAADAIKFTVDQQSLKKKVPAPVPALPADKENDKGRKAPATAADAQAVIDRERELAAMVCSLENKDACLSCGS